MHQFGARVALARLTAVNWRLLLSGEMGEDLDGPHAGVLVRPRRCREQLFRYRMSTRTGLARSAVPSIPVHVRFDGFELDEANASLLRDGKAVAIAPTPFAVLCALARQPGSLITKAALLDAVWGHRFVSESVLKTAISELRAALEDHPRQPRYIETVSRRGYRFIASTTVAARSDGKSGLKPASSEPRLFVGRGDALARLQAAWVRACAGERVVAWVAGDAGIGKTTLIDRFISGLGDVATARGQCVEQHGAGEPYLPILEALAELSRRDGTVAPLLRAVAPAWLLQLPWLSTAEERDALRRDLAGVGPDRMLREMGEFFDRYTGERPLLLVTEDLHWSDHATIQLLNHVARRRGSARLMWLASFRLADIVAYDHPLKALRNELRLHGLCEEIVLDGFSEGEVAEYVTRAAPSVATDEAFVRALHERTDGLPLFVAYAMTDVLARGVRDGVEAPAVAELEEMAVPETLVAIIEGYIEKLGDEERAVLSAAAVSGVEFRATTVAHALGREASSVDATCDRLAHERLWLAARRAEQGSSPPDLLYSFRHALVRQVLYERTGPLARAELHRKVGGGLERERAAGVPVAAAELATHFERGHEPMTALRYYAEAAEGALQRLSPAECLTLSDRGLSLLDQSPAGIERHGLEITLAKLKGVSAEHLLGVSSAEAKSAFQRAYSRLADVPRHPMRGLLLHEFGFVLCMRAEYAEALALAERAEALAAATDDPVLRLCVCTVQGEVQLLQGRPRAARAWAERGLAAIAALDAPPEQSFLTDPEVTLLGLLAMQLLELGLVETARARMQEANVLSRRLAQPMVQMIAIWFDCLCGVRLGDAERVAALADEMRALVDKFALAQGRTACRWFRGWADARLGEPRDGYRRIREAREENVRLGMLAGASETGGYAVEALVLAGDWSAARHELEQVFQFAEKHGERVYRSQLFLLEAAIARGRGEPAAAHASVRRAVEEARAHEAPWLELTALLELCEHDGATAADRHALAALVDQLPEAIDTTAVKKARALLGKAKAA
jgi:DNA-binding winged helix-turn-helix (wHTH) protein